MENLKHYSDQELFSLVAEGNKEAFTQIFQKYSPQLASFITGFTKSDWITDGIIQEIFMRVWFNREKLGSVNDPAVWIFRIAAGVCHNSLKKLLIENKVVNFVHQESYYGNNEVETARFYKLASDIRNAVKKLNPDEKVVYRLSREKGLKIPEIAEELSLSPNNIRNLLSSSTETVYDYLQNKGHSFL